MKYLDFIHHLDISACLPGKSCQWDCSLLKDVDHRSTLDSESLTCVQFDLCGLCL